MDPFDGALDAIFASVIGIDATFRPAGGGSQPVRLIPSRAEESVDLSTVRVVSETNLFDLRVSEVAAVAAGDKLQLDGEAFEREIKKHPKRRDTRKKVWTLSAPPPA